MGTLVAPDELRRELEAIGTPIQKPRSSFLFQRGDEVIGVFLITQGEVLLGLGRDLPGFPMRRLSVGSLLGLPATLSDTQYSLTAEIVEDSRFIYVPRPRLLELLQDKPELSFHVMAMLTEELTQTREAIERTREAPG